MYQSWIIWSYEEGKLEARSFYSVFFWCCQWGWPRTLATHPLHGICINVIGFVYCFLSHEFSHQFLSLAYLASQVMVLIPLSSPCLWSFLVSWPTVVKLSANFEVALEMCLVMWSCIETQELSRNTSLWSFSVKIFFLSNQTHWGLLVEKQVSQITSFCFSWMCFDWIAMCSQQIIEELSAK